MEHARAEHSGKRGSPKTKRLGEALASRGATREYSRRREQVHTLQHDTCVAEERKLAPDIGRENQSDTRYVSIRLLYPDEGCNACWREGTILDLAEAIKAG
jgi:hypothetical protein